MLRMNYGPKVARQYKNSKIAQFLEDSLSLSRAYSFMLIWLMHEVYNIWVKKSRNNILLFH